MRKSLDSYPNSAAVGLGIIAAVATGCGARTGLNTPSVSSGPECRLVSAELGRVRNSALTPDGIRIVTRSDTSLILRANTAACLRDVVDAARRGVLVMNTPRGIARSEDTDFQIPSFYIGDRHYGDVAVTRLVGRYGINGGMVAPRTDELAPFHWTLMTELGIIQGDSAVHVRSQDWSCTSTPAMATNLRANQLGSVRTALTYDANSIGDLTVCFGLGHPNSNINSQLETFVRMAQGGDTACLLDMPGACRSGQICSTENVCVDASWCQTIHPGETATFILSSEAQRGLGELGLPFSLSPDVASSYITHATCPNAPVYQIVE